MAVLQNIRNRAGVFIIIFVGVALFLFIIDPSTFNGLVNRQETNIAKIDGEKVPYSEFTARLLEVENFYKTAQQTNTIDAETEIALREQVWQEMLNDYLLGETFEDLGIQVSEDEMEDMLFGYHIHSIIQQNFSNPQTGMIDTNYVRQFFQNPDMDDRFIIITEYLKSQISKDRQNTKYLALLNHGMYTPTALAKSNYFNTNNKVDFAYIAMRYKDVADEEVTVTEDELMAYYEDHKYMFQNEESSRELEYIVFPVLPNTEDSVATKERMVELRNLFANTDDNMGFAQLHSEEVFAKPLFAKENVPGGYGDFIFENKEVGYISEIFSQDTSYNMFKVNSFITVPDSVKASHILLIPDTTSTYEGMYALLDSLKTAVENGADFAELAKEYSDGPSNVEGGDLGWFKQGAMVQQFNDACFYGNEGDMPIVGTQFGLHLINIEKQSAGTEMAELAIVKKHIDASSNTEQKTYANVSLFASENNTEAAFDKAVVDQRLVKRIASNVIESDREIRGLKDSRELIKWAYGKDIEPGTISNVFEIRSENCYVVAKLSQIREEGTAAFEQVKDQIEPIVIRKKKAEMIEAKIKEAMNANKDLRALANNLNTQVDTAKNIAFNSFSVPKLGIEPKLISSVANTDVNAGVSAPVEGNNAVYVFTVVNKTEAAEVDNYDQQKAQLTSTMRSRVNYEMVEAMQKATEIEDNRSRFF